MPSQVNMHQPVDTKPTDLPSPDYGMLIAKAMAGLAEQTQKMVEDWWEKNRDRLCPGIPYVLPAMTSMTT